MSNEAFKGYDGSDDQGLSKKAMRKHAFFEIKIWMILFSVCVFCLALGTGNMLFERQYKNTATAIDLPYVMGNTFVVYTNPEGKIRTIPLETIFKDINDDQTITIYYQHEVVDGKPLTPIMAWIAMYLGFGSLAAISLFFTYKNVHVKK